MLDLNVSAYIIKGVVIALHAQCLWYYFFSLKDPVRLIGDLNEWVRKKNEFVRKEVQQMQAKFSYLLLLKHFSCSIRDNGGQIDWLLKLEHWCHIWKRPKYLAVHCYQLGKMMIAWHNRKIFTFLSNSHFVLSSISLLPSE